MVTTGTSVVAGSAGNGTGSVRLARMSMLAAIGVAALMIGVLVYLADRSPSHPGLLPAAWALDGGPLFGSLGAWLPSFVHPFAFALLGAALQPPRAAPVYGGCLGWWLVNVAFEVGQHPRIAPTLVDALGGAGADSAPARALANYFAQGRFDAGDLLAATLGALAAAALLRAAHRKEALHVR